MLRKIEETRRQATKMKEAQRLNEEKLQQMQLRDHARSTERFEKQIRVLEDRKHRANVAETRLINNIALS